MCLSLMHQPLPSTREMYHLRLAPPSIVGFHSASRVGVNNPHAYGCCRVVVHALSLVPHHLLLDVHQSPPHNLAASHHLSQHGFKRRSRSLAMAEVYPHRMCQLRVVSQHHRAWYAFRRWCPAHIHLPKKSISRFHGMHRVATTTAANATAAPMMDFVICHRPFCWYLSHSLPI